ncbi:hypothetical protein ACHAQH_006786 [Verticillium albo-atrum]
MSSPRHMLPLADHAKYQEAIRDTIDGNVVLPHTIEAGDNPYYIGDVYNETPAECVQEWELDDKQAAIRKERASRTNVAIVDFAPSSDPAVHSVTRPDALSDSLRNPPARPDVHRLYVVEDLSRDVVEALGAALDIDALFLPRADQRQPVVQHARPMGADPRIMLRGLSQIVCAEWLTVIRYITTRLGQVEWELENPDLRRDPSGIDSSLARLHPWRRSVPLYKALIKEATAKVFNSGNGPVSEYTLSLK